MLLIGPPLGNSLAVELPALDRATLVRVLFPPFSFCSFSKGSLCVWSCSVIEHGEACFAWSRYMFEGIV